MLRGGSFRPAGGSVSERRSNHRVFSALAHLTGAWSIADATNAPAVEQANRVLHLARVQKESRALSRIPVIIFTVADLLHLERGAEARPDRSCELILSYRNSETTKAEAPENSRIAIPGFDPGSFRSWFSLSRATAQIGTG